MNTLDRHVDIGGDNNGIVITGDNAQVDVTFIDARANDADVRRERTRKLTFEELRLISSKLIEAGRPPSLIPLFSTAPDSSLQALARVSEVRRTASDQSKNKKTVLLVDLMATAERHHLITALPGSGKTHALWRLAKDLLDRDSVIPLFLPVGGLMTWEEVEKQISDVAPDIDASTLFQHERIVTLLDGWSQFASDEAAAERAHALRIFSTSRLIANGRLAGPLDAGFRIWSLDLLSTACVSETVALAFPAESTPSVTLLDLLRIPLALSLYVLLGGKLTTRGQLLSKLHNSLSKGFPEQFRDVLSGAAASLKLSKRNAQYSAFENEIRERAKPTQIANATKLLEQLGTILDRGDRILPIHDLYWSWLVGVGLLSEEPRIKALLDFTTRESYDLALQSGASVKLPITGTVIDVDIVLAASLATGYNASGEPHSDIDRSLATMFADQRLSIRCRAAQAAFRFGRIKTLRQGLDVLSEIDQSNLYVPQISESIDLDVLLDHQGMIAQWIGKHGTELLVETIAKRGSPQWGNWLEQAANSGKVRFEIAGAAALACEAQIPTWVAGRLPEVIGEYGSELRAITTKGNNVPFARWLAEHYDELVNFDMAMSRSFRINEVLVACRDDSVMELLLKRFLTWHSYAQETIAFAIVNFGDAWIAKFQETSFSEGDLKHLHKLKEVVSHDVSEETARHWVKHGPVDLGWRTLIVRYGNAVVPELVSHLPNSFDGIGSSDALDALKHVKNPPASLATELIVRVRGTISPKIMESIIFVLAQFDPKAIIGQLRIVSSWLPELPTYHLHRFIDVLKKWKRDYGFQLMVKVEGRDLTVTDWSLRGRLEKDGDDVMFQQAIALEPDLAISLVLDRHWQDDKITANILANLVRAEVPYHEALYGRLLGSEALANFIPKLFARSFDCVPESQLILALNRHGVDFREMVRCIASKPSAAHIVLHEQLARDALGNGLDLHLYRDVAKVLQVHARETLLEMLGNVISDMNDNALWLIREVELARAELLIDESGEWLP